MSDYQRQPNENWLQENQGETVLLQFPFGEYAVTVHSDEAKKRLVSNDDTAVRVIESEGAKEHLLDGDDSDNRVVGNAGSAERASAGGDVVVESNEESPKVQVDDLDEGVPADD